MSKKNKKCLGIILKKYVQVIQEKHYKNMIKGIKENPNKWRDILCSLI